MTKQPKLVGVDWVDSSGPNGDSVWLDIDKFHAGDTHTLCCSSVGYLLFEDASRIRIAAHLAIFDEGLSQVSGVMTIPKVAITKMRRIKCK